MKNCNKNIKSLLIFTGLLLITNFLFAQNKLTKYFLSYNDFIQDNYVDFNRINKKSFYKAIYTSKQLNSLLKIDSKGMLIEKKTFEYNKTGSLLQTKTYDKSEHLISKTTYYPTKIQKELVKKITGQSWKLFDKDYYTITTYDTSGNSLNHKIFSAQGNEIGSVYYEYDTAGNLNRETWFKGLNQILLEYFVFDFSPTDSIQTVEQYDHNDSLISKIKIKIPE